MMEQFIVMLGAGTINTHPLPMTSMAGSGGRHQSPILPIFPAKGGAGRSQSPTYDLSGEKW